MCQPKVSFLRKQISGVFKAATMFCGLSISCVFNSDAIAAGLNTPAEHLIKTSHTVAGSMYQQQPGDIRKYGAKIDGTTDNTESVNKAIAAEGVAFIPKVGDSKTLIAGTVTITKQAKITGDGTITTVAGEHNVFNIKGGQPFTIENVNVDLPVGYDGDFVKTADLPTYRDNGIIVRHITGKTQGKGKFIAIGLRSNNAVLSDNNWRGGTAFCMIWAGRNADIFNNTVYAANRAILMFGGSFNKIHDNTVDGENIGVTGINFLSFRRRSGADNIMQKNVVERNTVQNVKEEGISFDCVGNDSSRTPENPTLHVATVARDAAGNGDNITVSINEDAGRSGWADRYAAVAITGDNQGAISTISSSSANGITVDNSMAGLKAGDKVLITTGMLQNIIRNNKVSNTGTHSIALYGSCWRNLVANNIITGSTWRGISVVSVLGFKGGASYSGLNLIEGNTISMNPEVDNGKKRPSPWAAIGVEARQYSKTGLLPDRNAANFIVKNKFANNSIKVLNSSSTALLSNRSGDGSSGVQLLNSLKTRMAKNTRLNGAALDAVATDATNLVGGALKGGASGTYTANYNTIAPQAYSTVFVKTNGAVSDDANVQALADLPDNCLYTTFAGSGNTLGVRIFNVGTTALPAGQLSLKVGGK